MRGMARGALAAQVVGADLVDVERDQVHGRIMVRAVPAVAIQKAVDDVLGVRVLEVGGDDGGEFGTRRIAHEQIPSCHDYMPAAGALAALAAAACAGRADGGAAGGVGTGARTARRGAGVRRPRSCGGPRVLSRRRYRPAEGRRPVRPAARAGGRAGRAVLFDLRDRGLLSRPPRDQAGAAHAGLRASSRLAATAGRIEIARTASEIERIHASGKIAAVLDIEGSFDLDGDPAVIRADVPAGHAIGAAFRAQLDQQLCGLLLLAAPSGTA